MLMGTEVQTFRGCHPPTTTVIVLDTARLDADAAGCTGIVSLDVDWPPNQTEVSLQKRIAMANTKVRLRDVAALAGVSTATVSNVVNGRACVAAHTRARVETILKQVDYEPDEHAVALRRGTAGDRTNRRINAGIVADGKAAAAQDNSCDLSDGLHDSTNVDMASDTDYRIHDDGTRKPAGELACELKVGDTIRFRSEERATEGQIDAVMPDGSGLWVWCFGGGRQFFLMTDMTPEDETAVWTLRGQR